ncbi:uncharacterized protein E0L32_009918 [Thyridium curvatum]|uniref:YDG domain-containing protein n=1 Tax=Thyridium curvatum TaxID=1093900 RepID=A0A507AUI0_9PEZI|nr:uncharacterized protein E0L32_009918 [Thyridium curvatum]TPX08579.1 hypothetical protein E0L32_009918 [Thyridium curvatum]
MTTPISVPDGVAIGQTHQQRVNYLTRTRRVIVSNLLVQYKKPEQFRQMAIVEAREPELDGFLAFLESPAVAMTPELKKDGKIDVTLNAVIDPGMKVPDRFVQRSRALLDKFEDENWGGDSDVDDEAEDGQEAAEEASASAATPSSSNSAAGPSKAQKKEATAPPRIRYPARNHPIFGEDGIMHGAIIKHSAKTKTYLLDDRYQATDAKRYGHNGLTVGAWFPIQLVAMFNGAHGARVAGISGSSTHGAYSVVVSGAYDDLDRDLGNIIYYSGSGSHKHEDPENPPKATDGTKALKASLDTGNLVRVLRSSSGKSSFTPKVGLRYDGLYKVVGLGTTRNSLGGQVELFKLQRMAGQTSLEDLVRYSPTRREKRDFTRYRDGY